jgi:transposase
MLTQEEYVQRVLELKRQGWSIREIAAEVGYHPATVSKWLKAGGPPDKRTVNPSERVIDERWATRIDALIAPPSKLLARSVFEIIRAEGYPGSYPSVVRHVRARRGPRFRVAPQVSVPIETGPGEESLCGIPHRDSYGAPGNMRRSSRRPCSGPLRQPIYAT